MHAIHSIHLLVPGQPERRRRRPNAPLRLARLPLGHKCGAGVDGPVDRRRLGDFTISARRPRYVGAQRPDAPLGLARQAECVRILYFFSLRFLEPFEFTLLFTGIG